MATLSKYVDYLNQLCYGNIEEGQIKNDYYQQIKIERNVIKKIQEKLLEKPTVVILTGHAGDGKTSILTAILEKTDDFDKNSLEKKGVTKFEGKKINWLKDFSELNTVEQIEYLSNAIENSINESTLLISNLGPLMKNFLTYFNSKGYEKDDIESSVIKAVDSETIQKFTINNIEKNILIVNVAKIDNTGFASQILKKLLNPNLWDENKYVEKEIEISENESNHYKNLYYVYKNLDHIAALVQKFYQYEYENNRRVTIRQMTSHIAFALTGCLSSNEYKKLEFYKNNFAHFFFGCIEDEINKDALLIEGIKRINENNYDLVKIENEDNYFINGNFDDFPGCFKENYVERNIFDSKLDKNQNLRKRIRRTALFFSKNIQCNFDKAVENLFSSSFIEYMKYKYAVKNEVRLYEKELEGLLLSVFQKEFMGQKDDRSSTIYITLKRETNFMQNVKLVTGEFTKRDMKLELQEIESGLSDNIENFNKLVIRFKNKSSYEFSVNYPLFKYFKEVSSGIVKTKIDPHLSNGLDALKSYIRREFEYNNQDEIKIMVTTSSENLVYDLEISDGREENIEYYKAR